MTDKKYHEIVVLGGNFGGLGAAHYLLRHVIPILEKHDNTRAFRITLVSPNTRFFFTPASPRSAIQPDLCAESKLWRPLADAFKRYPASRVRLVQAVATGIDTSARTITAQQVSSTLGAESQEQQTIAYDSLIISTGTKSPSALWTLRRDENLTSAAFKAVQASLPKAKTILIAGGGPLGVEAAGEISSAYPNAKVTLLSGDSRLLLRLKRLTSQRAQDYLEKKLGVVVIHNVRVKSNSKRPSESEMAVKIPLSDGSTHSTDLYIDTTGGVPNSEFIPRDWLDETGRVITKGTYFRVRGSANNDPHAEGIYALGDIVAGSSNTIVELDAMVPVLCTALGLDIAARYKLPVPASVGNPGLLQSLLAALPWIGSGAGAGVLKQKEFKPMKDTIMISIGANGGVGQIFGWQVPSWFVKWAKAKTYFVEMIDPIVSGEKWKA